MTKSINTNGANVGLAEFTDEIENSGLIESLPSALEIIPESINEITKYSIKNSETMLGKE